MFYDHLKGLHHEKSLENLKHYFGKNAQLRTQVFFLFDEFKPNRQSLNDVQQCGTPATAVTVTNIEASEKLIKAEPRVTTREIQEYLCIRTAVTMSTLYDHLCVRKQCARSIPCSLTDERRWVRVGCVRYVEKVQWRLFKNDLGSADRWRDSDLFIRSGNQNADQAAHRRKWLPVLQKIGPCCHHSSRGQTNSHCGLVCASLSPESP